MLPFAGKISAARGRGKARSPADEKPPLETETERPQKEQTASAVRGVCTV